MGQDLQEGICPKFILLKFFICLVLRLQVLFTRIHNFGMFFIRHVLALFGKFSLPKIWNVLQTFSLYIVL
jgi:hypothetical protein